MQYGPPKAQVNVLESVKAGAFDTRAFGAPGSHMGGSKVGVHGALPVGFLVAGLAGELHIPKDPVGTSIIFKAGTPPAITFV